MNEDVCNQPGCAFVGRGIPHSKCGGVLFGTEHSVGCGRIFCGEHLVGKRGPFFCRPCWDARKAAARAAADRHCERCGKSGRDEPRIPLNGTYYCTPCVTAAVTALEQLERKASAVGSKTVELRCERCGKSDREDSTVQPRIALNGTYCTPCAPIAGDGKPTLVELLEEADRHATLPFQYRGLLGKAAVALKAALTVLERLERKVATAQEGRRPFAPVVVRRGDRFVMTGGAQGDGTSPPWFEVELRAITGDVGLEVVNEGGVAAVRLIGLMTVEPELSAVAGLAPEHVERLRELAGDALSARLTHEERESVRAALVAVGVIRPTGEGT